MSLYILQHLESVLKNIYLGIVIKFTLAHTQLTLIFISDEYMCFSVEKR